MYDIYPSPCRNFRDYGKIPIKTTEQFIDKAQFVWSDAFDYSKVEYEHRETSITITCRYHNEEFTITPRVHIQSNMGGGCPKCIEEKIIKDRQMSVEQIIKKAKEVHGDAYDYSLVEQPKNSQQNITVTCKTCNTSFPTMVCNHISKDRRGGCPTCRYQKSSESNRSNTEEFIKRSKNIHNNKYLYDRVKYVKASDKVIITCLRHGDFECTPDNHIHNHSGCPICRNEKTLWNNIGSYKGNYGLYIIRMYNDDESFFKIGVCSYGIQQRYSSVTERGGYTVSELCYIEGEFSDIVKLEHKLHQLNKNFKYRPKNYFAGISECFSDLHMNGLELLT